MITEDSSSGRKTTTRRPAGRGLHELVQLDPPSLLLAGGDYDNDTFVDLAVGAPFEDVGGVLDAGAVDTLNGSAGRLTPTGGRQFFQGNGGVPGTPEEADTFGSSLA